MVDKEALKQQACRIVDQVADQLIRVSDWMYENPELGLSEFKAAERLTALLDEYGAEVERGVGGLPTAFNAKLPGAQPGPKVAIVAEYDALPDVGHGCGHNIIATTAIGAGIALAHLAGKLPGSAVVIGTPAEESAVPNAGGKLPVLDAGYFNGVDAAIMIHPSTEDYIANKSSLVAYGLEFHFHGRPAHAAANPHEGINALDACIQTFNNIAMLRQQVRSEARIHGIIISGGGAPNVIPPYAAARFRVRHSDPVYAAELVNRVVACAEGAAKATGARLEWKHYMRPYLNMAPNFKLGDVLHQNLKQLGRPVLEEPPKKGSGSTDFGNVSHQVPASYAYLGICGPEAGWHSKEVAAATITPRGHAAIVAGAKMLAMSAIDLICDPEKVAAIKQEHDETMAPIRAGLAKLAAE